MSDDRRYDFEVALKDDNERLRKALADTKETGGSK